MESLLDDSAALSRDKSINICCILTSCLQPSKCEVLLLDVQMDRKFYYIHIYYNFLNINLNIDNFTQIANISDVFDHYKYASSLFSSHKYSYLSLIS
jgi:hypothetical protein